ncbi:hypothetical protein V8E54_011555 [Elaphomyces granulatus]
MAEEKRKQEIQELDLRHSEAQMTGTAGLNCNRNRPCGRLQNLLSSVEHQQVLFSHDYPRRSHLRYHYLLRRRQNQAVQEC